MYIHHCSKCKKICKKKDGKWTPDCECGIRCSPSWPPPNPTHFSEGITRTFSLTEPEPEPELKPELKPIGEWLSQGLMNQVKETEVKGLKVVPTRIEKKNSDKPIVKAYRVNKGMLKSKRKSKKKSKKRKTKRRKSRKRINKY